MKSRYVDKIPFLAICTLGGMSERELLELKEVTQRDVELTRKLLTDRGFSIGTCKKCGQRNWLDPADYCMKCVPR